MDKRQLNLEIILCRALVKRARVCVVRKLLKRIKLLRSCKDEENREKKFRKARRLVAEIHIMKTLRPDYVTKFALVTENYSPSGSNTKQKRKRNASAKIAKHRGLMAKINSIRNKFINWREELPRMLESAKKKTVKQSVIDQEKIESIPVGDESKPCKNENKTRASREKKEISDCEFREHLVESVKFGNGWSEPGKEPNILKSENGKHVLKAKAENKIKNSKKVIETPVKDDKVSFKEEEESGESGESALEKIDDPFFLGKKIIVPKLLKKDNENQPETENMEMSAWNEDVEQELRPVKKRNATDVHKQVGRRKEKREERPEPRKKQTLTEGELHPSWKAKKMQTIKPFQGKIIKFE